MTARGIYDKNGELFGYLDGSEVYDLNDTRTGFFRDGAIYAENGEIQWIVRGDGLYDLKGESVGYLGENFREDN